MKGDKYDLHVLTVLTPLISKPVNHVLCSKAETMGAKSLK